MQELIVPYCQQVAVCKTAFNPQQLYRQSVWVISNYPNVMLE